MYNDIIKVVTGGIVMENIFLSNHELESFSIEKKREYFEALKAYCQGLEASSKKYYGQELISRIYPLLRNYDLEIMGAENIPKNDTALFVCNHSNSHDIFTAYETLAQLKKKTSVLVASDCLSPFTKAIFTSANATMIDRNDKVSTTEGTYRIAKKILSGTYGFIFGEATWNLHPCLPMQHLKIGATKISAITDKTIIPTIFEYIEIPEILSKEEDLYSKCIICFGEPFAIKKEESLIKQTRQLKNIMENMRTGLWKKHGIKKDSIQDIDKQLYINHTYLKKFKALGFTYDSFKESQFIYRDSNSPFENEYHINESGEFSPGIIKKKVLAT